MDSVNDELTGDFHDAIEAIGMITYTPKCHWNIFHSKRCAFSEFLYCFKITFYFLGLLLVRCTRNPPLFFAEALEKAVSGLTTDSKAVTRIVVTRAEVSYNQEKCKFLFNFVACYLWRVHLKGCAILRNRPVGMPVKNNIELFKKKQQTDRKRWRLPFIRIFGNCLSLMTEWNGWNEQNNGTEFLMVCWSV